MVFGQNLQLIASHFLPRTHLCLMGVDVRKIFEASTPRIAGWPREVVLIRYRLEGDGKKCRC